MIKYLTLALFITSCASSGYINPEFESYYEHFENIYNIPVNIPIDLMPKDAFKPNKIGRCYTEEKRIEINSYYWQKASEEKRIVLIFHELGHCIFSLKHRNDLLKDNCASSIMHRNIRTINKYCFNKHEKYYYEELL